MIRPLFAVSQVLFAALFTMPGCGKTTPPAGPPAVSVGQAAPEIEGTDLQGTPIKLSEHRGKVVALSFWASWCPPCRALFPHERELVEKYKDRPFVFLGVNGDLRERGFAAQETNKLNWRSFSNGGPDGPITSLYGVEAWPTTFIIDAKGIVRRRFEGAQPAEVERAVETLLRNTP